MYTHAALNVLFNGDDHEAAHAYMEGFVDHIPRSEQESRESVRLAVELIPKPVVANLPSRRTIEALIELRRLEREARQMIDPCVPPLRLEARVLRSLIAYMARPVLVLVE